MPSINSVYVFAIINFFTISMDNRTRYLFCKFKNFFSNPQIIFEKHYFSPQYSVDFPKFTQTLEILFANFEKQPQNSNLIYLRGQFIADDDIQGEVIDTSYLITRIKNNINLLSTDPIYLTIIKKEPYIKKSQTSQAQNKVNELIKQKIILVFGTDKWNLSDKKLFDLLEFLRKNRLNWYVAKYELSPTPIIVKEVKLSDSQAPDLDVNLDAQKLTEYIEEIAKVINTETVDATLVFDGQKVTNFTPAKDGQLLDEQTTKKFILDKISIDNPQSEEITTINLPVVVTKAKIANDQVNSLGIKELIGRGISYFTGSIQNRIYNISLGSSRINGILIKPGEIFSFNSTVGEVSAESGYKKAYVISSGRTVLDDGGGICQVSTTVFRAALNAGLPIVKRTAHAYRVSYYEKGGFKAGLDATVWAPAVDFQFKNDTGHHILVQTIVDSKNAKLLVDIYGTSDNKKVEISDPVISNVKPAPPELRQEDPTLPKGTVKQVDFAAQGATSVFNRKVYKDSNLIIDESFKSVYRPWQAVYLVGTGS